jgi:VWFA-related protein
MHRTSRFAVAGVLFGAWAGALAAAQNPTFRGSINLLRLDVTVVTDDGTPVTDLKPEDFVVTVDGRPRPVRSAEFLDLGGSANPPSAPARDSARSFSTNQPDGTGRITILAIDAATLVSGQERALMDYLGRFLDHMTPADRTGLLVLPHPSSKGRHVEMTNDAREIRAVLDRVQSDTPPRLPDLQPSESIGPTATPSDPFLGNKTLYEDVMSVVRNELTNLADVLTNVEGPKTLVLVSGALAGGAANMGDLTTFAEKASRARIRLYIVRQIPAPGVGADGSRVEIGDAEGLYDLAGLTGGVVLDAVGRGQGAFERIARETNGSYLLGVEPDQSTPFSKPLKVSVKVTRPGLTVRSPKQIVPPLTRKTPDVKETLGTMLMQPRLSTEIPMRIAAFTARGEKNKLKSVLLVEMENAESPIAWGFQARQDNKIRADAFEPSSPGEQVDENVRSLSTSALLAPGQYRLIFGAIGADGRRGTVQHPLDVTLHKAGDVEFSDVFVGTAVKGHFRPRIVFGPDNRSLVAFVEIYPAAKTNAAQIETKFDLACETSPGSGQTPYVAGGQRVVGGQRALPPAADKLREEFAIELPLETHGDCTVRASVQNGPATGTAQRGIVLAAEARPAMLPR